MRTCCNSIRRGPALIPPAVPPEIAPRPMGWRRCRRSRHKCSLTRRDIQNAVDEKLQVVALRLWTRSRAQKEAIDKCLRIQAVAQEVVVDVAAASNHHRDHILGHVRGT